MNERTAGTLSALVLSCCLLCAAAERELPDELTLNVGAVEGIGTNVTLVLTKRSMRAANYLCGFKTDEGFKSVTFPVSTYRGYVQGDPAIRVNGNIEPGDILNANLSAGKAGIAWIRGLKVDVGTGAKSTPTMSTGNKVVPLESLQRRELPTPSGCLVPRVPMRQSTWTINVPASYTTQFDLEKVVSRVEQRWNDGDFVFARDVGTAWEIETILVAPAATKGVDWDAVPVVDPGERKAIMYGNVTGVPGKNNGKGNSLNVSGDGVGAGILLHEGAHLYGNPYHQMDPRDGLFGGGSFFGRNNVQVLVNVTESPGAWCHRGEEAYPGVIYGGVLPPSAMRDIANTQKDTPVSIDVLENDYDGNGDEIFLQAVTPESEKGGSVAVSADRKQAIYTPPAGFAGLDQFSYTVVDSTGAANKSGFVKVNVRPEGLAFHCDFESVEKDGVEWLKERGDWRMWCYDSLYKTPEADRVTYHFATSGPYGGEPANALWINYVPVKGVRGNGLLGGGGPAQVDLTEAGDPGRASLSASIWVLFPQHAGGVILCKSSYGFKTTMFGWAMCATGQGFSFFGNTVRPGEGFELHSEEPIQPKTWYHLVMVLDRDAKKLRAYVNNKEVTASSSTCDLPDAAIEYHAPLRLFNGAGYVGWGATQMLVDEVKLFASALTPKQVADLYAEGKDAPVPELP